MAGSARAGARRHGVVVLALLPLLVVWLLPRPQAPPSPAYFWIHTFAELFAVFVSTSVFAIGWSTRRQQLAVSDGVLGPAFLAVGLFDLAHALSFSGMPDWVTPNSPNKTMYFWLAGRLLASSCLLAVALRPRQAHARRPDRWALWAALGLVAVVYAVVLGAESRLPPLVIPGAGVSRLKIAAEIAVALISLAAFVLLSRSTAARQRDRDLSRAALCLVLAAIPFIAMSGPSAPPNLLAHVYKIAACVFVYRAIFVEGVRAPYEALAGSLEALRKSEEQSRRSMEMVAHAQRMEALGRLAGGVAHDFNNLLMVIFSAVDLIRETLGPAHPVTEDLDAIRDMAARARSLTRRLLELARRHPSEARRIDAGAVAARTAALAQTMVGSGIELSVLVEPGVHPVIIDPTHLEQVLLNLIINARDAMSDGGRIVLGVVRRSEGVCLCVEDTGCGMTPEVAARAFDPFFTTKPDGKGTGLGLASSFGIVTQAGGHMTIDSEPGRGTRMNVLLPLAAGEIEELPAPARTAVAGGPETILIAEDDPLVRAFTERILRRYGYQTLCAANGLEALTVAESHGPRIDLLLSDVVMPRVGGHELAPRLRQARPDIRVLLVSGYSADLLDQTRFPVLAKPYTADVLLRRIREILDQAA